VRVDCAPVNEFGYIGWAKGTLAIKNRTSDGSFIVQGGLHLRYKFIDGPEVTKDVQVEGTIDRHGQYVSALVVSGAPDLESVFLVLSSSADSHFDGPNGSPAYQTRCGASTAEVPQGSDLRPEGSMRYAVHGDKSIGLMIDVVNIGNQPASGTRGRVMIGTSTADAELSRWIDATETTAAKLNPGEHGFIWVVLPPNTLARCMQPKVVIDLDHTFQSGAPDPFGNDTAEVWTPCMTWSRPITADSIDPWRFDPTDPFLIGKTLGKIIGSYEIGRKKPDGTPEFRCSHCHFTGSGRPYSPPVAKDESGTIGPTDLIGDTTWAAGWVIASRSASRTT
jgi:hypothetical protein